MNNLKMDYWIKNNLNVLFIGKHGIGKSSIILEAFDRNKLNWKYFSAATMDPWVDFIGIPKEINRDNESPYLDLIRPKDFQDDTVEAIFFDEFNRSHKKIRNAVMELIQFKSINGKKFKKLKIVWAAINPEEEGIYDVEKIDPAQMDRFQVHYNMNYKCDKLYFIEKYGEELAVKAIEWWNDLNQEIKDKVTPRRLDYALDVYTKDGDVNDVLPKECNVSKFLIYLKNGGYLDAIRKLADENNPVAIKNWCQDMNNITNSWKHFKKYPLFAAIFYPHIPQDVLIAEINKDNKVFNQICNNAEKHKDLLNNMKNSPTKSIRKLIEQKIYNDPNFLNTIQPQSIVSQSNSFLHRIENLKASLINIHQTPQKINTYNSFVFEYNIATDKRSLTNKEATACFDFLNYLVRKSHSSSIKTKYKGFEIILQKLILSFNSQSQDFEKSYPSLIKKLNQAGIPYLQHFINKKVV